MSTKVILIEDNQGDARLIEEYMYRPGGDFELFWVDTMAKGVSLINESCRQDSQSVDAILLDLGLPDSCGLDSLTKVVDSKSRAPIIVLTGIEDEEVAVEAVRRGAQDYLPKGELSGHLLERSIRHAIERKRAEEAFRIERDKAKQYLDIAGAVFVAIDRLGTVTLINNKGCEVLGYREEEIIGENWFESFVPERIRADAVSLMKSLLKGDEAKAEYYENPILNRQGEERIVAWHNTVIRDEKGTIIGQLSSGQDVTERRRAAKALVESELRFKAIFEGAKDGIVLIDNETKKCHAANVSFCTMVGFSQEEIIGTALPAFFQEESRTRVFKRLERHHRGETSLAEDFTIVRKNGTVLNAEFTITSVVIADEEYILGIVRDITEKKQLQTKLAQSDRMASVGMLAAGVAHEINNPLTYVVYNLENVSKEIVSFFDAIKEHWNDIPDPLKSRLNVDALRNLVEQTQDASYGVNRIQEIVRDIKTFSRVDEDRKVRVYLHQVIDGAVNMATNEIKYRARLVKDYQSVPAIMACEGRLSQVFLNLLVNAAQAIDEGCVECNEILVRTWTEGDNVFAEIRDTGTGIPKEHLERLFDPFFTTKPVGVGSGLGLSICKGIITSHGGSICVESRLGKGTKFLVRLPIAKTVAEEPRRSKVPSRAPLPLSARGRVLVVDDEQYILSTISRILKSEHDVEIASSGSQAMGILKDNMNFDLIVCDMMMSQTCGIDLFDWINKRDSTLSERIVFITGGTFTPRAIDFFKHNDNIVIEKPFSPKKLRKVVNELVFHVDANWN